MVEEREYVMVWACDTEGCINSPATYNRFLEALDNSIRQALLGHRQEQENRPEPEPIYGRAITTYVPTPEPIIVSMGNISDAPIAMGDQVAPYPDDVVGPYQDISYIDMPIGRAMENIPVGESGSISIMMDDNVQSWTSGSWSPAIPDFASVHAIRNVRPRVVLDTPETGRDCFCCGKRINFQHQLHERREHPWCPVRDR
jgi:hypothetical protein